MKTTRRAAAWVQSQKTSNSRGNFRKFSTRKATVEQLFEALESRQMLSVGIQGQLPQVIQLTGLQAALLAKAYPSLGLTLPADGEGIFVGTTSSAGAANEVYLGPSSVFAADQPRVAVQVTRDPEGLNSLGPDDYNTFLLDSAATTVLVGKDATAELLSNGADFPYTYYEAGVGGLQQFYLSGEPGYSVFYNGVSIWDLFGGGGIFGGGGTPTFTVQQIDNVHMLAAPDTDLGFDGLIGTPAMVGRVTELDMSVWARNGLDFMSVNFPSAVPSNIPTSQRYEFPLYMHYFDPASGRVDPEAPDPTTAPMGFAPVRFQNDGHVIDALAPIDTGAQLSIISTQTAIALGLDTDLDGNLDHEAEDFLDLAGVGGVVSVPVVSFDSIALRGTDANGADTNLKWDHMFAAVIDIDASIPGIFGCDLLTSGWFEYLFEVSPKQGYLQQAYFDYTNVGPTTNDTTTASGRLVLNVTPDRQAPAPNPTIASLTATAAANPGDTITLTALGVDFHGAAPAELDFYFDVNDDGILQPGLDLAVGQVTDFNSSNISVTVTTEVTDPPGLYRFLARAANSAGYPSNVVSVVTSVGEVSEPTTIESATATPSVVTVGGSVSVTANNVTAGSGATLASVSFYRDANANGLFDDGVDPVIGTDSNGTDGWSTSALTDATWGLSATSLFARALDSLGNWSAPVAASVYLNAKPVVNSFSVAPAPTLPTSNLTLKATSVTDANLDGSIASVSFYRDVNNNGKFESALDTLISTDTDGSDGFTADYAITNAPTGTLRFFAIATDDQGASSTAKLGLVSVTQKPVVGSLTASTDLLSRGASLTLTANDVSDPDGLVASVEFWLDRNNSGLIDTGDLRLGVDSKSSDGWGLTFATTNLAIGPNQLLARAIDKVKMIGDAVGTTVTTDAPPTLSKVVASPAAVTPDQSVTLTASGASVDTSAVNFYLDNGDGKFSALTDTLLSTDTDGSDGWTNTTSAAGLVLGKNVFFAQAVDPIGGVSLARSTYTKVSTAPQILGSFTATPNPVSKGQNLNLSVTDITDDGSVASVLFYRDVDNDGQATAVDKLLGSDSNGLDGWSINLNSASTNLVSGINRLLAVAKDNLGLKSAPVLTLVDVNAPPAISSFSASLTKATTLQSIKFTVKSSVDTTGVDLFLDNGDGLFDATTDSLLASPSKDIVTGNWIYTAPAGSLPIGSLKLWARATDGLGYSVVRSVNVVIS